MNDRDKADGILDRILESKNPVGFFPELETYDAALLRTLAKVMYDRGLFWLPADIDEMCQEDICYHMEEEMVKWDFSESEEEKPTVLEVVDGKSEPLEVDYRFVFRFASKDDPKAKALLDAADRKDGKAMVDALVAVLYAVNPDEIVETLKCGGSAFGEDAPPL